MGNVRWLVVAAVTCLVIMWVWPGSAGVALAFGITGLALLIAEVIRTQ